MALKRQVTHGYDAVVLGAGHKRQKCMSPSQAGFYLRVRRRPKGAMLQSGMRAACAGRARRARRHFCGLMSVPHAVYRLCPPPCRTACPSRSCRKSGACPKMRCCRYARGPTDSCVLSSATCPGSRATLHPAFPAPAHARSARSSARRTLWLASEWTSRAGPSGRASRQAAGGSRPASLPSCVAKGAHHPGLFGPSPAWLARL